MHGMHEVRGSIPLSSTNFSPLKEGDRTPDCRQAGSECRAHSEEKAVSHRPAVSERGEVTQGAPATVVTESLPLRHSTSP